MLENMNSYNSSLLSRSRWHRERGFTLYEILVVVAIIGLVVAIGYPMMRRSLVRAQLLGEVNTIKQAVSMARINALKQGGGVAVRFLNDNAVQEGGVVLAWVDNDGDGAQGGGETTIGQWKVKGKVILKPDPANPLFKLAGTGRGLVFLPNGMAIASESGSVGVGQGAVVMSDHHQNDIRLLVRGGTGTVVQEMWDPDSGAWSDEMRFWKY